MLALINTEWPMLIEHHCPHWAKGFICWPPKETKSHQEPKATALFILQTLLHYSLWQWLPLLLWPLSRKHGCCPGGADPSFLSRREQYQWKRFHPFFYSCGMFLLIEGELVYLPGNREQWLVYTEFSYPAVKSWFQWLAVSCLLSLTLWISVATCPLSPLSPGGNWARQRLVSGRPVSF